MGTMPESPAPAVGPSPGAAEEVKVPFYYLSMFGYRDWFYHRVAKFIPRAACVIPVFLHHASGSV